MDREAECVNAMQGIDDPLEFVSNVSYLLAAAQRAAPWLAKAAAEGVHHDCAAPNDLISTGDALRAALARFDRKD